MLVLSEPKLADRELNAIAVVLYLVLNVDSSAIKIDEIVPVYVLKFARFKVDALNSVINDDNVEKFASIVLVSAGTPFPVAMERISARVVLTSPANVLCCELSATPPQYVPPLPSDIKT